MSASDYKYALSLFNEKVNKLKGYSFIDTVMNGTSSSFKWTKDSGQITRERIGPSAETIDAFVLTFRFFIQNNEACSLQNLAKIYQDSLIPNDLQDSYKIIRSNINNFLDSGPSFGITFNDDQLTYRTMMEGFIYGDLSHNNKDKVEQMKLWMSTPISSLIENEFITLLAVVFKALEAICNLNDKAINELEAVLTT
ncbi:hypothetical protein QUF75_00480 [Desulfococcaceae bacterium HSG7]|nr:hypothetical protein [Desulfococcaceae bacterium HSG7]